MGTTLVNLQIRELTVLEANKFSSDCIIKNLSKGWTTIISEKFDIGSLGKVARTISKKIDKAILSVEYYDDEMLMMNVYSKGKVITSHVTEHSYGYLKKRVIRLPF